MVTKMWKAYQDDVIEAHKTDDLSDSQPTKGNIAGGLTTIEEKALGNLEKIGQQCTLSSTCWSRPKRRPRAPASTTWTPRPPRPNA